MSASSTRTAPVSTIQNVLGEAKDPADDGAEPSAGAALSSLAVAPMTRGAKSARSYCGGLEILPAVQ